MAIPLRAGGAGEGLWSRLPVDYGQTKGMDMDRLYCICCGRPFMRPCKSGPAPIYCSPDCRLQMRLRRRAWERRAALQTLSASQIAARVPVRIAADSNG